VIAILLGRLKATWKQEFDRWQQRDLSARHYVYISADGVYLLARMKVEKASTDDVDMFLV
jgi:hypothetical protein